MRSLVLRHRFRMLSRVAAAGLFAGFAAGCSSDFSRFDAGLQPNNVSNDAVAQNPYPGVDQTATGSVGQNGGPVPAADVSTYQGEPDHQGYNPNLAQAAPNGIQRSELPKMEQRSAAIAQDSLKTGSVGAKQTAAVGQQSQKGWSPNGGTTITLRDGETLYNLSRRYGVPVKSIMQANNIANADHVRIGQQIVIPSYTYGDGVGVSAPDNDPNTQRASSARGNLIAGKAPPPEQQSARQVRTVRIEKTEKTAHDDKQPPVRKQDIAAANLDDKGVDTMITGAGANKSSTISQDNVEDTLRAKANEGAPERTGIGVFRWPVRGRIISNFGDQIASGKNDGIDISVPEGTAVKAVENGVVVYAGNELQGLGNLVLVQHADGWVSAYAHNREIEVKRGDKVRRGEILARSGRSGNADTPKLHFELRRYSKPVDPVRHLDGA